MGMPIIINIQNRGNRAKIVDAVPTPKAAIAVATESAIVGLIAKPTMDSKKV